MGATEFCGTPKEPSAAHGAIDLHEIARPKILDPGHVGSTASTIITGLVNGVAL
jgi:hypothetical protein